MSALKDPILVSMTGEMRLITGLTFSYADLKEGTRTLLPRINKSVYVPEGLIRGRWRHICVHMIKEVKKQRGDKLTLSDLNWLYIGGVKDSGPMDYNVLRDLPEGRLHVFGSCWGFSDPLFMERKVQVEDARPTERVSPDIIYGQRTDPVQRGEIVEDDLADGRREFDTYYNRLVSIRTGRKERQQAADDAKKNRLNGKNGASNGKNGASNEEPTVAPKLSSANMPHSREIIPPDTELNHNVDILRPTAVQLGMILATLRKWAENPYFGARVGRNMGLVDLTYDVVIDNHSMGKIAVNGRKRQIVMPKALEAYEKLFWDQFDSINFRKLVLSHTVEQPTVKVPVKLAPAKKPTRPVAKPRQIAIVKRAKPAASRRHAR